MMTGIEAWRSNPTDLEPTIRTHHNTEAILDPSALISKGIKRAIAILIQLISPTVQPKRLSFLIKSYGELWRGGAC